MRYRFTPPGLPGLPEPAARRLRGYWGTRASLLAGLALALTGTLGAGLWGLSSAPDRTLAGRPASGWSGAGADDGGAALPPARLVQTAAADYVFPGGSPGLDWPSTGTAAVEVDGMGPLGNDGSMTRVASIASITKTMTAYLVLRDHPLATTGSGGPTITITSEMAQEEGASSVPVVVGEQLTERQALEALMLASAGDMADILAIWDAGSVDAFLTEMNKEAKALGMTDTDYTDPSGLASSTTSTMADQLLLAEAVEQVPALTAIVAEPSAYVPEAGTITNYNQALGHDSIDGIKTGTTAAAGSCLLFSAHYRVDGRTVTILGIVLGLPGSTGTPWSALDAAERLARSAEQALGTAVVASPQQVVGTVMRGTARTVSLVPAQPVAVFGWPGLHYTVQLAGTPAAANLKITRTGGSADPVTAPLEPQPAQQAAAGRKSGPEPESGSPRTG